MVVENLKRGPIWIDFHVPVEFVPKRRADNLPLTEDECELHGIDAMAEHVRLEAKTSTEETGIEMTDAISQGAFPISPRSWKKPPMRRGKSWQQSSKPR